MAAKKKTINLALQGGGAHGAFTWGVLDCLLEDGRVGIEAISGTSAGAVNGAVLIDGYMKGGEDGARKALRNLWEEIARIGAFSPIQRSPWDIWQGNYSLDHNPAYQFFDVLTRMASPYDLNPLDMNPLRDLVDRMVDFGKVRASTNRRGNGLARRGTAVAARSDRGRHEGP